MLYDSPRAIVSKKASLGLGEMYEASKAEVIKSKSEAKTSHVIISSTIDQTFYM